MDGPRFRFRFSGAVDMKSVEETLLISAVAAEALHGRTVIQIDGDFEHDSNQRVCLVDASTNAGRDIALIFAGLLAAEFGETGFQVEVLPKRSRCGGEHGHGH